MSSGPDGLLLVDKPAAFTSHDVVDAVRRTLGTRRVGHAGTLDPMATGLLLVGVGRATRLLRFFGALPKAYEGTARLGVETDTLDADGAVVRTSEVRVSTDEVERAFAALLGQSMQRPPAYSAVKVRGRKLYEAARAGRALEAPPRPIRVDEAVVRAVDGTDVEFSVVCSGGTYVRVLIADVGASLGCGAHLRRLRRTRIGPYEVTSATRLDALSPPAPIEAAVAHLPRVDLGADEARAASHGSILAPAGLSEPYAVFGPDRRLIGIYRDHGAKARPEVILSG